MEISDETFSLYLACASYGIAFTFVYIRNRYSYHLIILASTLGLLIHSISLILRWNRVGHGPFINLYEILSSNVWSLMLGFLIFLGLVKSCRQVAVYIVPFLVMLVIWLLTSTARDTYLPPTYHTIWLYFHVFSGKIFLGLLMLATGLAFLGLTPSTKYTDQSASPAYVQILSYHLLAFAFCFESLMLFFGAIWAQDAWGRYWAWDPLETWAFLTWLSVVFVLHWRTNSASHRLYTLMVSVCLLLAVLTFFGVPFISTAPHQGMV